MYATAQGLKQPLAIISKMAVQAAPLRYPNAAQVGESARHMFETATMTRNYRHPPIPAAFLPGLRDAFLISAVAVMGGYASPSLKKATGLPITRQIKEMLALWYQHRIDPPSYFELEMWRPQNVLDSAAYLTRYETKNGVFHTLNNRAPRPHLGNEMSDKKLFAEICLQNALPHAQTLLHANASGISWACKAEDLHTDLFVKFREGMGAKKTEKLTYCGKGTFQNVVGATLSTQDMLDMVSRRAQKSDLLVQRHLQNHAEIASLADQSLLTLRVITCLDENGEPEVTWAMLRLLTKLEPVWKKHARDMEYASPVDLVTGKLGPMTGDCLKTSHLRYSRHPETFEQLEGRQMPLWHETQRLALAAHRAFHYRTTVGWDIAITPEGPVLLEGNTNYDVMFLQRVHNQPIGHTRLGELLDFHIADYMSSPASHAVS